MKRKLFWFSILLVVLLITFQPVITDQLQGTSSVYADDDDDEYREHDDEYENDEFEEDEYKYREPSGYNSDYLYLEQDGQSNIGVSVLSKANVQMKNQDPIATSAMTVLGEKLIPINELYSYLNLDLEWFGNEQIITITQGEKSLFFKVNKGIAYINGQKETLKVPPMIKNQSLYIPVKVLSSGLGLEINLSEVK